MIDFTEGSRMRTNASNSPKTQKPNIIPKGQMTDTEKFQHLLKVLKNYAEQPTCYNLDPDYTSSKYTHCDDAFDDGAKWGEIMFARTLLESIEVG